jgi:phage anti-repressor protein
MDYFLELCNHENEFVVEHTKLQEYGVLTNINTSKDIKKSLERLFLIENKDYKVIKTEVLNRLRNHTTIKNEYKLTPSAFKLCLMRAKNTIKYAKFFIIYEQTVKNYQEYQIMYNKRFYNIF